MLGGVQREACRSKRLPGEGIEKGDVSSSTVCNPRIGGRSCRLECASRLRKSKKKGIPGGDAFLKNRVGRLVRTNGDVHVVDAVVRCRTYGTSCPSIGGVFSIEFHLGGSDVCGNFQTVFEILPGAGSLKRNRYLLRRTVAVFYITSEGSFVVIGTTPCAEIDVEVGSSGNRSCGNVDDERRVEFCNALYGYRIDEVKVTVAAGVFVILADAASADLQAGVSAIRVVSQIDETEFV